MTTTAAAPVLHVVTFAAAPAKIAPDTLRRAAQLRDAQLILDAMPTTTTPVAALGCAVRAQGAAPQGTRWVFIRQAEGASRWIFSRADIDETHARIEGYDGAEARADGTLTIDAGIPASVAAALRAAYDAARGVIEPSRVNAILSRIVSGDAYRGAQLRDCVYLVSDLDDGLRACLDTVRDLGGLAMALPVVSEADRAALLAPVTRSVEDEITDALHAVETLVAQARACAASDEARQLRDPRDENGQYDTSAHRALAEARERLALWRDRLGVQLGSIDRTLDEAGKALDVELDRALDAVEARREARRRARAEAAAAQPSV